MKNEHDITSLLLYTNSSISAEINSNILNSLSRNALCHIKTRVNLKYFVNGCLCKNFFASNSSKTPSNLISFAISLVTLRPSIQF